MAEGYQHNYAAFGEHVLRADWLVAEMAKRAEKVKATAESIAPVDETGPHPGRYKAAFGIRSGIRPGKKRRAFATVYNDSPEAFFVEFGTEHNPRHRTLGKALGIE
jgi:hypothetical protein